MEFIGNLLNINLSTLEIKKEPLDVEDVRKFIGGLGLCCKLASEHIKPGVEPFSPENVIIIGVGTLSDSPVPAASKITALTKCPIPASKEKRNFIGYGSAGTLRFGWNLKRAGYEVLVIKGRSEKPCYLRIEDEDIEICDASELWGKTDTYETADILQKRYQGCGVITIGKAGERVVNYAMGIADKNGTVGRTGVGAILGSKHIKAIITRGTKRGKIFDDKRLSKVVKVINEDIERNPLTEPFRKWGIHAAWETYLIAMNVGVWSKSRWDKLYGFEKYIDVMRDKRGCRGCSLGCRIGYKIKDGKFAGLETSGHYVINAMIGQKLEIEDHKNALKLFDTCNRAGLCVFTATSLIDWVTRLYTIGAIGEKETGGLVLSRDFDSYSQLLDKIINREGLGDALADGWLVTSERIGLDATKDHVWTGIVKGVDPLGDGRFWWLSPITYTYITNPRVHHGNVHSLQYGGMIHKIDLLKEDLKEMGVTQDEFARIFTPTPYYGSFNLARLTKHIEDRGAIIQSLGICDLYNILKVLPIERLAQCYSAVTGIEVSPEELKKAGERIFNLLKVINVREGFTRKDDICPDAWFKAIITPDGEAPMKDYYGERILSRDDLSKLLDDYYDERGWDKDKGIPTRNKLCELNLEEYIT